MNFHPSPEERDFQSQARTYLKCITNDGRVPRDDVEYQTRARVVREGLGERNWLTLNWGPPYGETSTVKAAMLQEEMAYHLVPRANDYGTSLAGPLLLRHGTYEQQERHLGPLAKGREWWCVGFTEPLAGSDLSNIKTRAEARGGAFVLTGQKDYGEWAQSSGWCHVLARTERGSTGREGLTWFLLDTSTPGIFLNPVEYTTGRVFSEIFLDDVVVPESAILGERGRGWDIVEEFLTEARPGLECIGWARRMLDLAIEYGDRTVGRRARLTEASVDIEVARLLSYRSLWPGQDREETRRRASMAKLFSSEVFQRIAETAINATGLQGQAAGSHRSVIPAKAGIQVERGMTAPLQRLYLESSATSIYLGASEIHRTLVSGLAKIS